MAMLKKWLCAKYVKGLRLQPIKETKMSKYVEIKSFSLRKKYVQISAGYFSKSFESVERQESAPTTVCRRSRRCANYNSTVGIRKTTSQQMDQWQWIRECVGLPQKARWITDLRKEQLCCRVCAGQNNTIILCQKQSTRVSGSSVNSGAGFAFLTSFISTQPSCIYVARASQTNIDGTLGGIKRLCTLHYSFCKMIYSHVQTTNQPHRCWSLERKKKSLLPTL